MHGDTKAVCIDEAISCSCGSAQKGSLSLPSIDYLGRERLASAKHAPVIDCRLTRIAGQARRRSSVFPREPSWRSFAGGRASKL